jgi:hypothetical protein
VESIEARILRAELRGDILQWRRLLDDDSRHGSGGWAEVMPTAAAMAAWRRFGERDLRLATRFAQRFVEAAPGADNFPHWEVEAVLRGLLGEELLLRSVDGKRAGAIMHALLFALVDDLQLDDEQVDDLLLAAERAVADAYDHEKRPPQGAPDPPMLDGTMHQRTGHRYLTDADLQQFRAANDPASGTSSRPRPTQKSRLRGRKAALRGQATLAGRCVKASMLRHSDERRHLEATLKRLGGIDLPLMVRAAFAVAVPQQFAPNADLREIAEFVAATRTFYDQLHLMDTEYLVRAALGETIAAPAMEVRAEILAKTLMLGTIADWWDRDDAAIDQVIAEAERNLAEEGYSLRVSGA